MRKDKFYNCLANNCRIYPSVCEWMRLWYYLYTAGKANIPTGFRAQKLKSLPDREEWSKLTASQGMNEPKIWKLRDNHHSPSESKSESKVMETLYSAPIMPFFAEQQIGMAPGVSGLDGTTAQSHTALVSCACTHGFGFIMAVSYPLCIPRQCAHTLKHLPLCCSQKTFRYRPSVRPLNLMSLTCGACPDDTRAGGDTDSLAARLHLRHEIECNFLGNDTSWGVLWRVLVHSGRVSVANLLMKRFWLIEIAVMFHSDAQSHYHGHVHAWKMNYVLNLGRL